MNGLVLSCLLYFQSGPVERTEIWHPVTNVEWEVAHGELVKFYARVELKFRF